MAGNTTTYTINFKAQYSDIEKLNAILAGMQGKISDGIIKPSPKTQAYLTELIASAKNLQQILSTKIDPETGMISSADLKNIEGMYGGLIKKVEILKRAVLQDVQMPDGLKRELEELSREFDALTAKQKAFQEQLKRTKGSEFEGVQVDKSSGKAVDVSKTRKNQIATETAKSQGLVSVTGKEIKTLQQIEAVIKRIRELQAKENKTEKESAWLAQYEAQLPQYEAALQTVSDKGKQLVRDYNMVSSQMEQNGQKLGMVAQTITTKSAEALASQEVASDAKQIVSSLTEVEQSMEMGVGQAITDLKTKQQEHARELEEEARKAKEAADAEKQRKDALTQLGQTVNQTTISTSKLNQGINKSQSSFGKAFKNVFSYGTALTLLRGVYQKLISTIKDMDNALTNMTVVTNLSREQAWGMVDTIHSLGRETGMASTEIANMTTMYLQQGKTMSEALQLTEAAAKAARIAGISGSESINLLTNAMNGFQLEASKAMEVSDKFAALAASAATDYEELATALSKVAAQANLAGMSMDFTLGLLTKGIETTREAPETIGTALKTVISRMRELTDYGETLEDGIDVNRVETALSNIGVNLLDANREFRDLDDVLTEVGMKWDTLNKNQQANVAVALAGTRQQSRLIAMMQNFDRTQELVNISMNSAGTTAAQHRKYMQGLEAATTQLTTSYQQLITSFTNSDFVVNLLNGIGNGLQYISENMSIVYTALAAIGVITGVVIANKIKAAAIDAAQANIQQQLLALQREEAILDKQKLIAELANNKATQDGVVVEKQAAVASAESTLAKAKDELQTYENTKATRQNTIETKKNALAKYELAGKTEYASLIRQEIAKQEALLAEDNMRIEAQQADIAVKTTAVKQAQAEQDQAIAEQKRLGTMGEIAAQQLLLMTNAQSMTSLKSLIGAKIQGLVVSRSVALGNTHEAATAAFKNAQDALSTLLLKAHNKEERKAAAEKLKSAIASLFKAGADTAATGATVGLTGATKGLSTAIKNIPLIGWILAIVALVIALIKAAYEMGAFTEAIEALKSVGKVLMDVFKAIFEILGTLIKLAIDLIMPELKRSMAQLKFLLIIVEYIIAAIQFVVDLIMAFVQAAKNLVKGIMNAIPGLNKFADAIGNIMGGLKKGLNSMKKWCKSFTDSISRAFEDAEDKSKRYAEEIAKDQEKIYDNQQKANTLNPLIEEYKALSQKANKSAEDMERLKAITDEIKQVDKSYIKSNGQVDWEKVEKDAKNAESEANKLLEKNKNKAIKGIRTGYAQDEFGSALSDYYSAEVVKKSKSGEISATTASAIANNLQTVFANLDQEALNDAYKVSGWDLKAWRENQKQMEADLDNLAQSVTDFETELADADGDMTSRLTAFTEEYESLPEHMRDSFASVYTIYKEYYDLMENLSEEGKKGFAKNLETLNMTEAGYNEMKKVYTGSLTQREGESDKAFAKRQEAAWESYFGSVTGNGEKSREEMIKALVAGQSTEVANAIESALVPTNQAAIETYMKTSSGLDNLQEASKKAAAGTLTMDEIRQLSEENPELFADQEQLEKFMKGEVDITKKREEARKALEDELSARQAFLQQRLADLEAKGETDSDMYKNYKAQLNLIAEQQKMVKYADIMASSLWTKYANQTKEMQKQIRLQAELERLQKERDKLNEKDADYGQKKLDLLMKERAIYQQQYNDAQKVLNSQEYINAKNAGLFEVTETGEVIYNAEEVKKAYDRGEIDQATYEFLIAEDTEEVIKNAIEASEEAEEGLEENIEELRSVAEWQYEKEKEILEKRQEQYEEYWDKVDALDEDRERAQSREDILNQLSAVSGGSDAASNSLRKDLLSQLEELNKEEAEARKEAMRDAITKNIDDHVASIDEKIDNLEGMSEDELKQVLSGMGFNTTPYTVTANKTDAGKFTVDPVPAYKQGGIVDYTGPAWVDGTKTRPEAFLSATDTALISQLVQALSYGNWHTRVIDDSSVMDNIVIENINITTNELNTKQDFRTSGQIFAEEFSKAMRQRGINVNARK